MFVDSVIDLFKMALEWILIGIFVILVIRVMSVRDSYATKITEKQVRESAVNESLEFSKYNTGINQTDISECILASEVIACIRKYDRGELPIYVTKADGSGKLYNQNTSKDDYKLASIESQIDYNAYYHPYLVYDTESVTQSYTTLEHAGDEVVGIIFVYQK